MCKGIYILVIICNVFCIAGDSCLNDSGFYLPERIISLAPTLTQELYILGAGGNIIANTIYCNKPEEAKFKDKIGSIVNVDVERIVQMKPDLVVTSTITRKKQVIQLQKLGINVVIFTMPESFSEICENFVKLGKITGNKKKAENICEECRNLLAEVKKKTSAAVKKKVFIQIGTKPLFTVTGESFINDYIEFCGGVNIAKNAKSGIYSREKVVEKNPDIIIVCTMGLVGNDEKRVWMKYPSISAVRKGNVYIMDSDKICNPVPIDFVRVLKEMVKLVHPEIELNSD